MENPGRTLGTDGTAASATKAASTGLPQSSHSRPRRDECDPVRASNRMSVERLERYRYLQQLICSSTVHGMDRSRSFPGLLGVRSDGLRRSGGHRLVLALNGWSDDQGTTGRGKKPAPTPQTEQRRERREVCSPKPKASLSASWSMARTETTSSWLSKQSRASLSSARSRPRESRKVSVWTRVTITPKSESSWTSSDSQLISAPEEKRRWRSRTKLDFVHGDGL